MAVMEEMGSGGAWGEGRGRGALLTVLIGAVIIICGSDCREAVRTYLQLSQKCAPFQINDLAVQKKEVIKTAHPVLDADHPDQFDSWDRFIRLLLNS